MHSLIEARVMAAWCLSAWMPEATRLTLRLPYNWSDI
jgi:hypothetical protein